MKDARQPAESRNHYGPTFVEKRSESCYSLHMTDEWKNYELTKTQRERMKFIQWSMAVSDHASTNEQMESWAKRHYASTDVAQEVRNLRKKAADEKRPLVDVILEAAAERRAKRNRR